MCLLFQKMGSSVLRKRTYLANEKNPSLKNSTIVFLSKNRILFLKVIRTCLGKKMFLLLS